MNFGYEGLGLFYTLLEKMAKQEKPVKTSVLKQQLHVGKKLEKCWNFMEEIGLISSNNGETFNKQLLKFSEKYQIKKEKNAKRLLEWREKQELSENETRFKSVRNAPKVKISKSKDKIIEETTFIQSTILAENEFSTRKIEKEISDDAKFFAAEFHKTLPTSQSVKDTDLKNWAETFDKLIRIDKRPKDEIYAVVKFARNDVFWKSNFMSANKLRMKDKSGVCYYDVFLTKMKAQNNGKSNPKRGTADELAKIADKWQALRDGKNVDNN